MTRGIMVCVCWILVLVTLSTTRTAEGKERVSEKLRRSGKAYTPSSGSVAETTQTQSGASGVGPSPPSDARSTVDFYLARLSDESPEIRRTVVERLAGFTDEDPRVLPTVLKIHRSKEARDESVRAAAVRVLGRSRHPEVMDEVVNALRDTDPGVRYTALFTLGEVGYPPALEPTLEILRTGDSSVKQTALFVLEQIADKSAVERVAQVALSKEVPPIRIRALNLLARLGGREAEAAIQAALKDEQPEVRLAAMDLFLQTAQGGSAAVAPRVLPIESLERIVDRVIAGYNASDPGHFVDHLSERAAAEAKTRSRSTRPGTTPNPMSIFNFDWAKEHFGNYVSRRPLFRSSRYWGTEFSMAYECRFEKAEGVGLTVKLVDDRGTLKIEGVNVYTKQVSPANSRDGAGRRGVVR